MSLDRRVRPRGASTQPVERASPFGTRASLASKRAEQRCGVLSAPAGPRPRAVGSIHASLPALARRHSRCSRSGPRTRPRGLRSGRKAAGSSRRDSGNRVARPELRVTAPGNRKSWAGLPRQQGRRWPHQPRTDAAGATVRRLGSDRQTAPHGRKSAERAGIPSPPAWTCASRHEKRHHAMGNRRHLSGARRDIRGSWRVMLGRSAFGPLAIVASSGARGRNNRGVRATRRESGLYI